MPLRYHNAFSIATGLALFHGASAILGRSASQAAAGDDPTDEMPRPPHNWFCEWRGRFREDICQWMPKEGPFMTRPGKDRRLRKGILNVSRLKTDVWYGLHKNPELRIAFFEAWHTIFHLQADDVFALKETWSPEDSHYLDIIEPDGNWVATDKRPPDAMRDYHGALPSIKQLYARLAIGNLAIVGGTNKLDTLQLGTEIDNHTHVVRFNKFIGPKLRGNSTGTRHTMHVLNAKQRGPPGMPIFDLDTDNMLRTFCNRFYSDGDYIQTPGTQEIYVIRPTRWCMMHKDVAKMSQSFLFYWFLGSLYPEVTLYGVMDKSKAARYNLNEFAEAEQVVYKMIAKQWMDSSPAVNLARTQLRVQGKSGFQLRS